MARPHKTGLFHATVMPRMIRSAFVADELARDAQCKKLLKPAPNRAKTSSRSANRSAPNCLQIYSSKLG